MHETQNGDEVRARRKPRRTAWTVLLCAIAAVAAVAYAYQSRAGDRTVRNLRDDEVVVLYDGLRDEVRVVDGPGRVVTLPVLHESRVLLKSPMPMSFSGDARPNPQQVPDLHLRTADGSPMRFEDFSLRYALLPNGARDCLEDTQGVLNRAARTVETYTRDVIAARFGEYDAEEVVTHDVLVRETTRCREELSAALAPHGLRIVEFSTPRPRFDPVYEDAVERRKVSMAEIERLRARKEGLPAELEDELAKLEHEKQTRRDELLMEAETRMARARRDALVASTDAELYAEEQRRRGEAERALLRQSAELYALEHRTAADHRRREVQRVAALGRTAVLEAWIERLPTLTFRVEPLRSTDDDTARSVAHRR